MKNTTDEVFSQGSPEMVGLPSELSLLAFTVEGPRNVPFRADAELVVGRHPSCQLCVAQGNLSRFHARFVRRGQAVMVEDLGSRHGTWLAGKRIEQGQLALGSAVQLADLTVAVIGRFEPAQRSLSPTRPAVAADTLWPSLRMRALHERLERVAPTDLPVALFGETGTGKELAAREIHRLSGRTGPLRTLNCAAISPQLIESTLFGHERGAFTGAERSRSGIFEDASGGTLFLDEVGELSLTAQAALLRVLETRRVTRIGTSREIEVSARIVSATNRDLRVMAGQGTFRTDLLHRLCVVAVELPPLRERREEIAPLARHFLAQAAGVRDIDPHAVSRLEAYDWPGNIRELRNVVAVAAAMARGPCIGVADLDDTLRVRQTVSGAPRASLSGELAHSGHGLGRVKEFEIALIREALQKAHGNQAQAARILGVPRRTLANKVHAYGLLE